MYLSFRGAYARNVTLYFPNSSGETKKEIREYNGRAEIRWKCKKQDEDWDSYILESFNLALITKQGGRILENPNSIVAQVFRDICSH